MKIENAKNLLIAIKDEIAKNLSDEDSLQFTKEFDNLIDNCDASKTYAKFCIKLLERVKLNVSSDDKQLLLAVNNVINLFKNNGTKEKLVDYTACAAAYSASTTDAVSASAASYAASSSAYAVDACSPSAHAASYAVFSAAASAAAAAVSAARCSSAASDSEYKQQSIDLLQVLKTKAGRPKGSKNFIKKEKNVKILIPESLLSRVKKFINKLLKNQTS